MDCCKTQTYETQFDENLASNDLRRYRRKGPDRTTRMLIKALKSEGVEGKTLLDIGAGVGAITHALLASGVRRAVIVDASGPYLGAARRVAEANGTQDQVDFVHGDFVELAPSIAPADIVTLDRVICCYEDMPSLVATSADRAGRYYGLVFPRDRWWVQLAIRTLNFVQRLRRHPFLVFAHPSREVEGRILTRGFEGRFSYEEVFWQVVLYRRA
jgi:magnesium-protoporphyrin O-methyltransferase